jgi:FlaA1/EpsC-like NDP-sugar epimerase
MVPHDLRNLLMHFIIRLFPPRVLVLLSTILLLILNVFSFYGLYTNKFYFLKFDNYIFPILSIVHFTYLYFILVKLITKKVADPQLRNVEYVLYFIFSVYVFKFFESIYRLSTINDFDHIEMPDTFLPIGLLIIVLNFLLLIQTLLTFYYRKVFIGSFKLEEMDNNSNPL